MDNLSQTIQNLKKEMESVKLQQRKNCQMIDLHENNLKVICKLNIKRNNIFDKVTKSENKIANSIDYFDSSDRNSKMIDQVKCKWYNKGYCRE